MLQYEYMKVHGKVIVVTGAGGGIGSELVLGLLSRGARVAAVDLRPESLEQLQNKASQHTDTLSIHACTITDKQAISELPDAVIKAHGQVDGVINCAGIIQPFVRVNELDYEAIDRVMNVNFYGTLYMLKAFLPHLLRRPEAHVVNVSSMGGFLPVPGQSVYGASKAAVKLLTEGLYAELLDTPVRVTVVFPGATNTNITQNSHVDTPGGAAVDAAKLSKNMLSASKAALLILNGMEKDKPQIFTGKDSKSMNKLYRLNPVFATKFIAKQMKSLLK
ncbi:MAG TPA: SDR family oxidoreductase [Candidatus Saccharimonadales bacterium]